MRTVVVRNEVDAAGLAGLRAPLDHFLRERATGPDDFVLDRGPFSHWERHLAVTPAPAGDGRHEVTTTVRYKLAVPLWWPLFVPAVRRALRRPPPPGAWRWWMPPLLDARSSSALGILCIFSLYTGYLGVLLSQTNTFFKDEFGVDNSAISNAQVAVRVGAFAAFAVVALADRRGRRIVLLWSTALAIALATTGAVAPNLLGITVSQGVARVFSAAVALVAAVMASEEVPAHARSFAISMLALTAGLGAGGLVVLLWVGDLSPGAWRVFYLIPLPFLASLPALARHLPESRRFEVLELQAEGPHGAEPPGRFYRRLVMVGSVLLLANLFLTPMSQFTNIYLRDERHFTGAGLTVFQLVTNLPGGAAIVVGGRLSDLYGRKLISVVGVVGGTVAAAVFYLTEGWALWVSSTAATVLAGILVPSLLVYPTELFATGRRGHAQGVNNVLALLGAIAGLKACGLLADHFGRFGPAITVLGAAPLVLAVIVAVWFPETSGRTLEDINPGDVPPPEGDELARLDHDWEGAHHLATPHAIHEVDEHPPQQPAENPP